MKRYICDWCKKETDHNLPEGWGSVYVIGAPPDHEYDRETEHMCPECRKHLKLP